MVFKKKVLLSSKTNPGVSESTCSMLPSFQGPLSPCVHLPYRGSAHVAVPGRLTSEKSFLGLAKKHGARAALLRVKEGLGSKDAGVHGSQAQGRRRGNGGNGTSVSLTLLPLFAVYWKDLCIFCKK